MKNTIWVFFIIIPTFLFSQADHWETAINNNDFWRYKAGSPTIPGNWTSIDFSDGSWLNAAGGIGYGDNDDNTTIEPVTSLYLRKKFNISDVTKLKGAILHADYDDGFVAYLNGYEIARSNVSGYPPGWDFWADFLHEAQLYQGGRPDQFNINTSTLEDALQNGNNVLAIQVHNFEGNSSSDLTANFWLSFGIADDSEIYGDLPPWFMDPIFSSHLPILKINSFGEDIPNEPRIPAEMEIIWNGPDVINHVNGPALEYSGNITIEQRGQSSLFFFPKHGYGIETKDVNGLDTNVSFLNFPEEEDWVLHGPYSDKTLMRNVLAMQLARSLGQYASQTHFVELVIHGYYEGIYVLMEKIKRDQNRVDIAKLNEDDIAGDELTGGYIFKIDKDEPDWLSQYNIVNTNNKLHFQHVYPKASDIQPEQALYIKSYVDSFENALLDENYTFGGKRYDEFIDLESFADQFIINEVSKNVDAYRFSTYYHKKKDSNGGKIHAGPAWDFNLGFGNADYCDNAQFDQWMYFYHCHSGNPFWWDRMLDDPTFVNIIKCRWEEFRQGPLSINTIHHFIDETAEYLNPALDRNFIRWPVIGQYIWPNPVVVNSYNGEKEWMKNFIGNRIQWLDENMFGNCSVVSTEDLSAKKLISLSPNPTSGIIKLSLAQGLKNSGKLQVFNMLGQVVKTVSLPDVVRDIEIDLGDLGAGTYILRVSMGGVLVIVT